MTLKLSSTKEGESFLNFTSVNLEVGHMQPVQADLFSEPLTFINGKGKKIPTEIILNMWCQPVKLQNFIIDVVKFQKLGFGHSHLTEAESST